MFLYLASVYIFDFDFCLAVTPALSDQRVRCFAAGRARSESAVPVLCSGFLWEGGCADSNYCEVSFDSFFFCFLSLCCDSGCVYMLFCCC